MRGRTSTALTKFLVVAERGSPHQVGLTCPHLPVHADPCQDIGSLSRQEVVVDVGPVAGMTDSSAEVLFESRVRGCIPLVVYVSQARRMRVKMR